MSFASETEQKKPRLTSVRDKAGDAADEIYHFDAKFCAQPEKAGGKLFPEQIGLFSQKEYKVIFGTGKKRIGRNLERGNQTALDSGVRPK